jgi:hypothetical protein
LPSADYETAGHRVRLGQCGLEPPRSLIAGKLPNLAALVASGRTYDLASFKEASPDLDHDRDGQSPIDHGVADFQRPIRRRARASHLGRSRGARALERGLREA